MASDVSVAQVCGLLEDLINSDGSEMSSRTHSKLKQIWDLLRQASAPSATFADVQLSPEAVNTMAAHDPTVIQQHEEGMPKKSSDSMSRRLSHTVWSTVTTATGMPAVEEQRFYSPSQQRRRQQLWNPSSTISYTGSLHRKPWSNFRRRLSHGHFNTTDVSEAQLQQLRQQSADGVLQSPSSETPQFVTERSYPSANGFLSISAPSVSSDDLSLSRQASDPCMTVSPENPNDIRIEQSPIPEGPSEVEKKQTPETIGIPLEYLPSVLATDMDYDGKGLVACAYVAGTLSEDEPHPAYKPISGEAVFSDLSVPESAAEAPLLDELYLWNYPIFELACETGGRVLSMLAVQLFDDHNLFEELNIPRHKFTAYFQALENGYRDNPYHNRIHAADVLQSMAYLLDTKIFGFDVGYKDTEEAKSNPDNLLENFCRDRLGEMLMNQHSSSCSWHTMRDALSSLELAACFIAAAQHDYDHPARTNSFLVNSGSDLAILYNDRAVLEQYHACSSWKLLRDNDDYNFLEDMKPSDVRTLRFMILEMILATDLAKHFELISLFRANQEKNSSDFLQKSGNRLGVMQMCIKIADINGPAKCGSLHRKWAYLICEEFYDQGRAEADLNLSISPYMDQRNPMLPKLQVSFIRGLLQPLLEAYALAGFMPGPYELLDEDDLRKDRTAKDGAKEDTSKIQSSLGRVHNHIVSVIMRNANDNEAFWEEIIKKEDEAKKKSEEEEAAAAQPSEENGAESSL